MDENEDDAIDPAEFQKLTDAMFRRLDTDGDGRLSKVEYKRFSERPRHRHRPHGPQPGGPDGGFPGGGGPY